MKTTVKAMICVLLVLGLFPFLSFGINAKSAVYDRQGAPDPAKAGDKELVMITRRDISRDVIRIRLLREYGYSVEKYEEGDDDSLDYDAYIAAKREVTRALYTSAANEFIKEARIDRSDIKYIGEYTGTVIAYLTAEKIEELKKNDYVDGIEPYSDNEEQPTMFIVPNQVDADSVSGTKSSSYNSGNGYKGTNITVGILEAQKGIYDPSAAQLASIHNVRLYAVPNIRSDGSTLYGEVTDHATMVTSLIVGQEKTVSGRKYEGIVPKATVYAMPVLYSSDIATGISLLADYGATVVNYSGGLYTNNTYNNNDLEVDKIIRNTGITFVVASGNKTDSTDYSVFSPGKAYNAITVGNAKTKSNAVTALSSPYSIESSSCYSEASYLTNKPDLCAPGSFVSYVKSGTTISTQTGTSRATPIVSGIVAQLHQAKSVLKSNSTRTKAALLAGASNTVMSTSGNATSGNNWFRNKSGAGLVNAKRSVDLALGNKTLVKNVDLHDYSPTGQYALKTVSLSSGDKIRVVLTYQKADNNTVTSIGYSHNIDLKLVNSSGSIVKSSTSSYNNVEIIEYTAASTGNYTIKAVFDTGTYISNHIYMDIAIAWTIG